MTMLKVSMGIDGRLPFSKPGMDGKKSFGSHLVKPLAKLFILGTICMGMGKPLAACPNEPTTLGANECQNQVLALNPSTEYQNAGEASRVNNGNGPRMFNKVEKVLL